MKTIQLLILTIFLSVPTFTNAQDASNDATWEETIGFFKKYSHHLLREDFSQHAYKITGYELEEFVDFGNGTIIKYLTNLKYLEDVKVRKTYISITLTGDYIKRYKKNGEKFELHKYEFFGDDYDGANKLGFIIKDTEWCERFGKAFEHLAFLAKEKREEERKASGDKF